MKPSSAPAKRKIFKFSAITFGITWAVAGILNLLRMQSGSIPFILLVALFYMTALVVATLVVSRRSLKESLQVYGLSWKGIKVKDVFLAIAFYLSFIALTFLLIFRP